MGWFTITAQGEPVAQDHQNLAWGDGPADVLDEAFDRIKVEFLKVEGRLPSLAEIRAGFEFCMGGLLEALPPEPSSATEPSVGQIQALELWEPRTHVPHDENRAEAWRHVQAVLTSLAPQPAEVPDSPADLDGPF